MITTIAAIVFISIILVGVGRLLFSYGNSRKLHSDKETWQAVGGGLAILAAIFLFVTLLTWTIVAAKSRQATAELEAFYRDTITSYEYAVTETERILIEVQGAEITDFSDIAASDRIAEFRNKVEWYNAKLQKYRSWDGLFFIGGMIDAPSDDLVPISLGQGSK